MGTQKRELGWRGSPATLAERTLDGIVEGLDGGCNTTGYGLDGVKVKGVQRRAGMGGGIIGYDEGDPGWVEGTWGAVMGHWVRVEGMVNVGEESIGWVKGGIT